MDTIDWSKYQAVRTTSAFPSEFDEKRFTIQQLRDAATRACILFRGWPFVVFDPGHPAHVIKDGLKNIVNTTGRVPWTYIDQWNLLRSGLFFHRTVMHELYDPRAGSRRVLDTTETIYHAAEAIGSLWRLYSALGVPNEEVVTIEFVYGDTQDRELVVLDPGRARLFPGRLCHISGVEVSRTFPLELWRASDVQIAAEICVEIFQQFQWEPSLRQLEDEIRPFLGRVAPGAVR